MQDVLRSIDPTVQGFFSRTLAEHVAVSTLPVRYASTLTAVSPVSRWLSRSWASTHSCCSWRPERTREIGLRMALGAGRRDVLILVFGYGMKLAGMGLAIGILSPSVLTAPSKPVVRRQPDRSARVRVCVSRGHDDCDVRVLCSGATGHAYRSAQRAAAGVDEAAAHVLRGRINARQPRFSSRRSSVTSSRLVFTRTLAHGANS